MSGIDLKQLEDFPFNMRAFVEELVRQKDEDLAEHMIETGTLTERLWVGLGFYGLTNGVDPYFAGFLHDIGKISISKEILWKNSKPTAAEWEILKTHSKLGYNMLISSKPVSPYAEIVLKHHERPDGTGYPNGVSDRDIPLMAKVVSVADMFSSLTSPRAYRKNLTSNCYMADQALRIIESDWKGGFSEDIFERIKDILMSDVCR